MMHAATRRRGTGLRARLAAFFIVITVIPLTIAMVALQLQINTQLQARGQRELATVRSAAVNQMEVERARAADLSMDLARRLANALADATVSPELDDAEIAEWLETATDMAVPGRADLAAVLDANGNVVAAELEQPEGPFEFDLEPLLQEAVLDRAQPEIALLEIRELRGRRDAGEELLGWVVTGIWLDGTLLRELPVSGGAAFVRDGVVVAAAGAPADGLHLGDLPPAGEVAVAEVDGEPVTLTAAPVVEGGDTRLVIWHERAPRGAAIALGLLILLPSVILAGALGWVLASTVIQPIRRAAETARAIAAGDLTRTLEPRGGPEFAELAIALNAMSAELAHRMEELSRSRDQLRGSLDRLGITLSSSLDLNGTLAVVVETAKDTLVADRALLLLFTPERDALYGKVARGLAPPPPLDADAGVVGYVAREAAPVLLPDDGDITPAPADGEPSAASQLAVPLLGRGRVLGVLTLLRDDPEEPFSRIDLDTIRSFAAQASVAIENVLLHQEARRLSVTDTLTGLWNFRYFQLQADRELQSASRFERALSLVIIDIDHFKDVNDEHGHQVGDVVLTEVARRIRGATRTPDVVARYGGEEFVVLLPGTDLPGAIATGERIRRAVSDAPIDVRDVPTPAGDEIRVGPEELAVTCSAGVATVPDHGSTVAALLRSADAAMYAAKRGGRNRVVAASEVVAEELPAATRDVSG